MSQVLLAAAAALLWAAPLPDSPPACRGTISGAVQATFECTVAVRPGESGMALFVIEPNAPLAHVPSYVPGAFEIPEPLEARIYTLESLGQGKASVAAEGGTLFTATKTFGQRGEVRIELASAVKDPAAKGSWIVHGTYRARLLPVGAGKSGEVVVEARF